MLQNLSGRYYAPRGKKITRLIASMKHPNNVKKTTLGGCILEKVKETAREVLDEKVKAAKEELLEELEEKSKSFKDSYAP